MSNARSEPTPTKQPYADTARSETSQKRAPTRGAALERFPIPNFLNAVIVASQLVAVAFCFYFLSRVESIGALFGLALVFGLLMNSVYSTIHEAHHRMLFRNRLANDASGIVLSLLFPAAFHLLRQGHLGHHRRNRSDDEAFDLYFDHDSIVWKFLAWYGILTGVYWLVVVASNFVLVFCPMIINSKFFGWDRTSEVFIEHFQPETFKIMRIEALAAIVLHAGIFWSLGTPWYYYFGMYFGFGLMWSSLQYVHHYQAERDVINGARNLHCWEPIDKLWLNHNWHQTHHQLPTVPWRYLPELAEERNTESSSIVPAYFRMWLGPRYAEPGVQNRYDGEVSK